MLKQILIWSHVNGKASQKQSKHSADFFLSLINLIHLTLDRLGRQISTALIISKLYFGKNDPWKMEVLRIFDSWDQEIGSWFTNVLLWLCLWIFLKI